MKRISPKRENSPFFTFKILKLLLTSFRLKLFVSNHVSKLNLIIIKFICKTTLKHKSLDSIVKPPALSITSKLRNNLP